MRHLSAVTVEATFVNDPPDVSQLHGVSNVRVAGHQLTCQVQGDIAPLLKKLAADSPKTLLSREPSLEELFLALYGENGELPEEHASQHGQPEEAGRE